MAGYIGSKASVVSSGAERKKVFTITTTTTSLTGLAYTPTKVHVFHNGIRLVDGTDYTATNGSSITLTNAAENGDEVVVVSYASFQVADAYTQAESDVRYVQVAGDTLTGALTGTDLTLSGGVYLGGTGSANKLDDYEEGTWTPVISGTGGNPTVTYVSGNTGGIYTKVGDTVLVSFEVRWSAISGGSGNTRITGLPFTRVSANNPDGDRSVFDHYNVTVPSGGVTSILSAGTGNNHLDCNFTRSGTTTIPLPVGNLINTNPGFIRGSFTYKV